MPRGDGTGPSGKGSMTGRQMGRCSGSDTAGFEKSGGRGLGRSVSTGTRNISRSDGRRSVGLNRLFPRFNQQNKRNR